LEVVIIHCFSGTRSSVGASVGVLSALSQFFPKHVPGIFREPPEMACFINPAFMSHWERFGGLVLEGKH